MANPVPSAAMGRDVPVPLKVVVLAGAVGAGAAAAGAAAAYGYALPAIGAALVGTGAWAGRRHLAYVLPAVLLVLTLNGIPGLNLDEYAVPGSFRPEDIFVIGLILLAVMRMLLAPSREQPRLQQYLWIWAPLFLLVWMVAVGRAIDTGTPPLKAALFGRDFLYFAVLAPLAGYLFAEREQRRRAVILVAAWTAIFSVLLILATLKMIDPSVVNARLTNEVDSVLRVYTPMTGLAVLTFCVSFAYLLIGSGAKRGWAIVLVVITGLPLLLSLTRALYLGLAVGIVVAAGLWALRGGHSGQRMRRRLTLIAATVGIAGVLGIAVFPQAFDNEPVNAVADRVEKGVDELTGTNAERSISTLANRKFRARETIRHVGGQWPLGLGFVPPSSRYVTGLQNGSIRDADLGLLNGLATMGVLGTALLYVPLLLMLGIAVGNRGEGRFLPLGLLIWGITVVVSSFTLVTLFTTTGLALTALVIGFATWSLRQPSAQM